MADLDKSLLQFLPDEETFLKAATGISDIEKLKDHIYSIQAEAYKLYPYPCIKGYNFIRFNVSRSPFYKDVLALGRERSDAIFLDVGCGVGNDVRKLIFDGFPAENIAATDLYQGFWDVGHKLFKTTPETYGPTFVAGDMFDSSHIALLDHRAAISTSLRPPSLKSLTSLNPLRGHVSAIQASWLFHLFDEGQQFRLASALGGLLDKRPGSIIFGSHGCGSGKGIKEGLMGTMFGHDAESWTELWENEVFEKGTVKVTAHSHVADISQISATRSKEFSEFGWLTWSVVRL